MKHVYTKTEDDKFTAEMFARVNANREEAQERAARKIAEAEWKQLMLQGKRGIVAACTALGVSATACVVYCLVKRIPGYLLFPVIGACLLVAIRETVLALKRVPAIKAAHKAAFEKSAGAEVAQNDGR